MMSQDSGRKEEEGRRGLRLLGLGCSEILSWRRREVAKLSRGRTDLHQHYLTALHNNSTVPIYANDELLKSCSLLAFDANFGCIRHRSSPWQNDDSMLTAETLADLRLSIQALVVGHISNYCTSSPSCCRARRATIHPRFMNASSPNANTQGRRSANLQLISANLHSQTRKLHFFVPPEPDFVPCREFRPHRYWRLSTPAVAPSRRKDVQ
jgi:hypothetical protein